MYYVTCNDSFLSGWGRAYKKNNKLIFECETIEEAYKMADWIKENRNEMKYVSVSKNPKCLRKNKGEEYYLKNAFVQIKNKTNMPEWYKKAEILKEEKGA